MGLYIQCVSRWLLSFVVAMSPIMAKAQVSGLTPNIPGMSEKDYELLKRSQRSFTSLGYDVVVSEREGKALVIRRNVAETDPAFRTGIEFPYTDDREVRKFSPKRFTQMMGEAARSAKPGEAFKHTLQRFPRESFLFFLAIGGVTAFQLLTEFSANPVRMEQHVHHSLSPMGMAGFFTFMYANGVTTNVLGTMIKNPKYHSFIPYLGMTAGFFVQTTLASFASDPNVKACVAGMIGMKASAAKNAQMAGTDPDKACEAAFEYYAVKRKLLDAAPGLISMLGSTFIAGLVQKGLVNGLYRWAGVNIAFLFVPGVGWGLASLRFAVVSILQMGVFFYIDQAWLMRPMNFAFKNIVDGGELANLQNQMVDLLHRQKVRGWADDLPMSMCKELKGLDDNECPREDLNFAIKRFQQRSADWRMTNLMEVYEGHQAWQDKLNNFAGMFEVAYDFLSQFVEEARNSKWKVSAPYRLEDQALLYGVKAKGLEEGFENLYFLRPNYTESMARDTVADVANVLQIAMTTEVGKIYIHNNVGNAEVVKGLRDIRSKLASGDSSVVSETMTGVQELIKTDRLSPEAKMALLTLHTAGLMGRVAQHEKNLLEKIRVKLASGDLVQMGSGIAELRKEYVEVQRTRNHRLVIYNLMLGLGPNPLPMPYAGQGFIRAYTDYSAKAQQASVVKFSKTTGFFQTPLIGEHLLVQAVCGPDLRKGESVVGGAWGFPVKFESPLMINDISNNRHACSFSSAGAPDALYRLELGPREARNKGIIDYVRSNLQPEILGDKENPGFNTWWSKNVEDQMKEAYDQYAEEYNNLMVQLVEGIHREKDSWINMGPMASGPLKSIQQTLGVQMLILGELTKDVYQLQHKADFPYMFLADKYEPQPYYESVWRSGRVVPLLGVMRQQGTYEWDRIVSLFPNTPQHAFQKAKGLQPVNRPLRIQDELQAEFNAMVNLINQIKVVDKDCRPGIIRRYKQICEKSISSPLQNSQLNEQAEKVGTKLAEWADMLGVGEGQSTDFRGQPTQALVSLSGGQKEVAQTLLEGIQGLVSELHLYGTMPNAVSWEKIRDLNNVSDKQRAHNEAMRAKIEQLSRLMSHRAAR